MKITNFASILDMDAKRNQWTMEVVADGRLWLVKGSTGQDGAHTIGVVKPKTDESLGIHMGSQLSKDVREFVEQNINTYLGQPLFTQPYTWPKAVVPKLNLETRAVLGHLIEELQAEFFVREADARHGHTEKTSLDLSTEYASARGFEAAIDHLLEQLATIASSRESVAKLVRQRENYENSSDFTEFDAVLRASAGKDSFLEGSR
ncbi:hypothetical protein [Corynebacterium sp.]|uniref:hypothetical protein n=1 Tax=Corynebacterium sp. TaxID=1720 RepID=UPI0028A6F502|nr:hypothetical protein [Corynebacterium sp.]